MLPWRRPAASTLCKLYVLPLSEFTLNRRFTNSVSPCSSLYSHSCSNCGIVINSPLISWRLYSWRWSAGNRLRSLTASNTECWSQPPWQWNSSLPLSSLMDSDGFLSPLPRPCPATGQLASQFPFTFLALPRALAIVSVSIFLFSIFRGKKTGGDQPPATRLLVRKTLHRPSQVQALAWPPCVLARVLAPAQTRHPHPHSCQPDAQPSLPI